MKASSQSGEELPNKDNASVADATFTILPVPAGEKLVQNEGMAAEWNAAEGHPRRISRFEIHRFLGEGVFGRVYEAYDPSLKRAIALKVAKPAQMMNSGQIERFIREARAASPLLHPNIVAVFDSGQDGSTYYLAIALVQGRSLQATLAERENYPSVVEAVELIRKLAEALHYAHAHGVVHRDIKPANILINSAGEPLLADFGLATISNDEGKLTAVGQFMGTPAYCSPEQWNGEASQASDQYSLGCVLYELLTGRPPFTATSQPGLSQISSLFRQPEVPNFEGLAAI